MITARPGLRGRARVHRRRRSRPGDARFPRGARHLTPASRSGATTRSPRRGARGRLVAVGRRVPARRRRDLAGACPTTPTSASSTSRPGTQGRTGTGASARATTSGRRRSSPSMRRRASSSGDSSKCTTTSGTTTPRAPSCSSTPPTGARESRRRGRPAGSTCSTARPGSRSTGSTRSRCRRTRSSTRTDAAHPSQRRVHPARAGAGERGRADQESRSRRRCRGSRSCRRRRSTPRPASANSSRSCRARRAE